MSPRPILFMHNQDDNWLSYRYSEKLYAAAQEPKSLWISRTPGTVSSPFTYDPVEYRRRVGCLLTHVARDDGDFFCDRASP